MEPLSQGQHPKALPARLWGLCQPPAASSSSPGPGEWWGSPFPRKRPPSQLLPRSGCIFEVGDFLTPPLTPGMLTAVRLGRKSCCRSTSEVLFF